MRKAFNVVNYFYAKSAFFGIYDHEECQYASYDEPRY